MYNELPFINKFTNTFELRDIRRNKDGEGEVQNKDGEWEVIENSPLDEFWTLLYEALRKKRIEQTCFGI
jgi:squalene cyclase